MSRELKFRGKVEGNWWYATPDSELSHSTPSWEQFWASVDKSTVGQYIGLVDTNAKEVYEGDILGVSNSDEPLRLIVVFHEGAFKLQIPVKYVQPFYQPYLVLWKVIGNVYDNPGLEKGK